ncbi:NAD-dependent histone deacetylase SIR2 [Lachancea thermotolerans CBS 6340]|uniref:KLTH0C08690p n=1 Tax=Lachancea thermotolerans (strain ATCC 56472 / CBS 6340 / NRRL Y-8284) TaxID=559295 RepID=C5DEF2_LACTC|nr:KLTH0C08690p [Lachancea thermotolerans CBS 6340]CAR22163.1 KLTH0C08690p [Lachancea thermotolerans CBS 6340]
MSLESPQYDAPNKRPLMDAGTNASEFLSTNEEGSKKPRPQDEENQIFEEAPPADELEDVVEDYVPSEPILNGKFSQDASPVGANDAKTPGADKQFVPKEPLPPISITMSPETGKYRFPFISKEDSLTARSYLKYYGSGKFLDTYLPEELNSLYIYHLIKLLGFQIKDKQLVEAVQDVVENDIFTQSPALATTQSGQSREKSPDSDDSDTFDDPLEKKHAVRLIKDLQKAMNKVLSTRMRLANFHTLDDFCDKLKTAKKVLVLTGAGISTSLGIPDFRSSEGFYSKIRHLGLDDPQDVFNYEIFMQDPSVFYNIAHMVLPPENLFSPLHSFIRMIQDKGKLLRNYTQNIDNLESYAGIQAEKMVQCHGSFATASCVTCHWKLPGEKIFDNIRNMELPLCPYCYHKRKEYFPTNSPDENDGQIESYHSSFNNVLKSYGVLKPDITFFGEALPSKFHRFIRDDVMKCDLLICIGTSLKVAPVSEIVNMIPASVPQVLINKDPVRHAEFDLSLLGFCDDVAALVTQKCGWSMPHSSWDDLKTTEYEYEETDRGVYHVKPKISEATSEADLGNIGEPSEVK